MVQITHCYAVLFYNKKEHNFFHSVSVRLPSLIKLHLVLEIGRVELQLKVYIKAVRLPFRFSGNMFSSHGLKINLHNRIVLTYVRTGDGEWWGCLNFNSKKLQQLPILPHNFHNIDS